MSGYIGCMNYETWAVSLRIDNEESSYRYWREQAKACLEVAEANKKDAAIELARLLKDEFQEARPELDGVWGDLLGAALSGVDWFEIAENMLEE